MSEPLRDWTERAETYGLEVILRAAPRQNRGLGPLPSLPALQTFSTRRQSPSFPLPGPPPARHHPGHPGHCHRQSDRRRHGQNPGGGKFARELQKQGRTVAILSRGYRSRPQPMSQSLTRILLRADSTPPRVVSDGKSLLLDSDTAGDEPYMLASNLKDVAVCRWTRTVLKRPLRHRKLRLRHPSAGRRISILAAGRRRQDIVLMDCQQPFGNEQMVPRGTLREPPSQLARASIIFITKSDGKTAQLCRRIAHYMPPPASSSAFTTLLLRGCFHRGTNGS